MFKTYRNLFLMFAIKTSILYDVLFCMFCEIMSTSRYNDVYATKPIRFLFYDKLCPIKDKVGAQLQQVRQKSHKNMS